MSDIESERDDSSSSSEEEAEEVIRSRVPALSVTRERRANAGSKMANLIKDYAALTQTADNDAEFYNTAYGGFEEDGDDDEFDEKMEEADDELDSDFDADETEDLDEPADDQDEDNRRKRPTRRKEAYEISADRRKAAASKKSAPKPKAKPQPKSQATQRRLPDRTPVAKRSAEPAVTPAVLTDDVSGKRSLRERKPAVREEEDEPPVKKNKNRNRSRSSRRSKVDDEKKVWTQAELLEEAKETERENLATLHKYQLLELEKNEAKKRAKKSSREIAGPFIRFVSTTMPVVDADDSAPHSDQQDDESLIRNKTERTFITFSDEQVKDQVHSLLHVSLM